MLQASLLSADTLQVGETVKKRIYLGENARNSIYPGFSLVADLARSVYGPNGRTVLSTQVTGQPHAAVRALDAAKNVDDADPSINAGVQFARALCEEVNDTAGDGSAASIIICSELLAGGIKQIAAGASPVLLKSGIKKAASVAVDHIFSQKIAVRSRDDVLHVASTAAKDRNTGALVCDALESVGWKGSINVRASETSECRIQHTDGLSFDRGYCSPYMSTDKVSMEAVFDDAYIFVCESKIDRIEDILPLLNETSIAGKALLIIAQDYSKKVLDSMLSNIAQQTIKLCAVKAPGYALGIRDYLEDIAAYTGTVVFGTEVAPDLRQASLKKCGHAQRVRVTRESTSIDSNAGTSLNVHISGLRSLLANAPNALAREKLENRIANLTGGRAIIRIGSNSGTEQEALTAMVNTSVRAAQSAIRGGFVPGGGAAFVHAIPAVKQLCASLYGDEEAGAELVIRALTAPAYQIAANAGVNGAATVHKLLNSGSLIVFDALSSRFCSCFESGIADGADILTAALSKAASMAAELLTVEAMVLPDMPPEKKEPVPDSLNVDPRDLL